MSGILTMPIADPREPRYPTLIVAQTLACCWLGVWDMASRGLEIHLMAPY